MKIRIIKELKNLFDRLQFKMKKSSMQQHGLKKYVEFTVYGKPDKTNKSLEICKQKKQIRIPNSLSMIKREQFSILKTFLEDFVTGVSQRSI